MCIGNFDEYTACKKRAWLQKVEEVSLVWGRDIDLAT